MTYTQPLNIPRNKHYAALLDDGSVVIVAGSNDAEEIGGRYNTLEIFNPTTNKMSLVQGQLSEKRFKITNAGAKLKNGTIVIAGDGEKVEIFDPLVSSFFIAEGNISNSFMYPTVTTTSNNNVLITGGYDEDMQATNRAWLYTTK